jgi:hypothetical protein
MWANAIILTETGKIEDDGTILENSIESYFVWIPRYKYKLFDMGNYDGASTENKPSTSNAKEIEIIFENKNTKVSVGDEVGEYYSHPAFDEFNANGIWVGKFETTGDVSQISIKPNKSSLRNINVKTMFESSYNYNRKNESHMMKNTEWGAVTYLSLSKYGINKEININNHSGYITGYSSTPQANQTVRPGTTGFTSDITMPYNTEIGYKASTTGNISGIYDMSGGAWEYMAGYVYGYLEKGGFANNEASKYDKKYFNIYPSNNTLTSYNNRILGDAIGEMGPFYFTGVGNESNLYHISISI